MSAHDLRAVWRDALGLCFGTLTALRIPPPRAVDKTRAGWAMTFAPVAGSALAAVTIAVLEALSDAPQGMVLAFLVLGLLALLTRGMHADGLADVADGLGAAKAGVADRARSLEVMRRGDVGPFGVLTLVVVVGVEAAALGDALSVDRGLAALTLALVVSRFVLAVLCLRGVPAARPDGLGSLVAGSVGGAQLVGSAILGAGAIAALWALIALDGTQHLLDIPVALAATGAGLAVAILVGLRCIRRFGGITGDVLGACVELSFAATLVTAALLVA